ncbi:MAG: O-antigen ligase family protein [Lachnospiraceae bacterium]|nr:O-antigen ligase family protein [Lachnospiraceae bacterium]
MTDKLKKTMQKLSDLWFLGVFVIFVYYTEEYYFNMLEAKASIFGLCALCFCGLSALCGLGMLYELPVLDTVKKSLQRITGTDIAVILLGLSAVLSNLVTPYKEAAFYGSFGWKVGTLWALGLLFVYLFAKGNIRGTKQLWQIVAISLGIQFGWVLLNGFYVDVLEYHANLAAKDYPRYVGSIGNTNWYVGFLALTLPFFYMGSVIVEKKWERIVLSCLLGLGIMSCFSVNCEGVYLFLPVLVGMGLWYGVEKEEWLSQILWNHLVMALSVVVLVLLRMAFSATPVDGITAKVLTVPVSLGAFVICGVMLWAGCKGKTISVKQKKKIRIMLMVIGGLLGILLAYTQWIGFDDSWGTNRGKIWRIAVEAFGKMSMPQKIFGGGISCFGYYYEALTGSDWVRNAHNELLEVLVTMGIMGLLSYLFLIFTVIKEKTKGDCLLVAGKIALLSYFAQALVNNPQGLNGAVFVTILALCRRRSQDVVQ